MRILLTGAAGYAGRGIAAVLSETHYVRSLDIREAPMAAESVVGSVADLGVCRAALAEIDVVVLCHMAPNPMGYATPEQAIDVNVKGTANLYYCAVEQGLTRMVLISSTGVLPKQPGSTAVPGEGPYNFHYNLYVLTKIMQEDIARFYHEMHGMSTIILRPAWIVYDEDFTTKYGSKMEQYDTGLIDPRDIGAAVTAALDLPSPGLEAIDLGQDDSGFDLTLAHERLGWVPKYRFMGLPRG
ncbi:MAG: 3 beta-hydroxysteroid dehydrogenase/Delta 5--_4-isomerase [bacterium ADurb.Bin429]|nr:MAG: 3 beta-hydroxysteroid dehydrogenase/Delta 5-->4-isomerase [bacterium ADurb.Bin429]